MKADQMVTPHKNVSEFFKGLIDKAIVHQKFKNDEMFSFYITNLLIEFLNIDKLFPSENKTEDTLTFALENAVNADYPEKISRFKWLGDFTLFVSGFFHESLSRSLVDVGYYVVIGKRSYQNLAVSMRGKNKKNFKDFYLELASKFNPIMDILSEVSEMVMVCNENDILHLYERWLRTNSKRDLSLLKQKGIVPIISSGSFTLN